MSVLNLKPLEKKLCYVFKDNSLLSLALVHPSHSRAENQVGEDYQRLEFLGDAVLSLILSDNLYKELPEAREGELALKRSVLAKGQSLANLAKTLQLSKYIKLSKAEEGAGGKEKHSILEDVIESIIGAIYLDSDFDTTKKVVLGWYGDLIHLSNSLLTIHNPKGKLQEYYQKKEGSCDIEYRLARETGPDHRKTYTVEVYINGKYKGTGKDFSKKNAEEKAALVALKALKKP